MNFGQLLKKLSHSSLSELAVGGHGSGVVPLEEVPKIAIKTMDALRGLYTRFPLDCRTLTLETVSGIYTYPLRREYAQTSDSDEPNKFIKDTPDNPFTGDIVMVTGVNDDRFLELPFNDNMRKCEWRLVAYDTLAYSDPVTAERFFVEYRANHPEIPFDALDQEGQYEQIEIRIPTVLERALVVHIASSIYSTMSIEGAMAKADRLMMVYENECLFHEERNTFNQWSAQSERDIRKNGWV